MGELKADTVVTMHVIVRPAPVGKPQGEYHAHRAPNLIINLPAYPSSIMMHDDISTKFRMALWGRRHAVCNAYVDIIVCAVSSGYAV